MKRPGCAAANGKRLTLPWRAWLVGWQLEIIVEAEAAGVNVNLGRIKLGVQLVPLV